MLQLAAPICHRTCWPDLQHLPALQETIYRHLSLLVPARRRPGQSWLSNAVAGPQLAIEVLALSRYTTSLRLYHRYRHDPDATEPNAHVRCYHDFRTAELIAFHTVPGIARHGVPPPDRLAWRILRRHLALSRWLEYLIESGHHRAHMRPAGDSAGDSAGRCCGRFVVPKTGH